MKFSIASTAASIIYLAPSTTACMQAYIGHNFIDSTIQSAIIYDNGGFICHVFNLPISPQETSYPLSCISVSGIPWHAEIIQPDMENFRPEQPVRRWAIRVLYADFNEQYVLGNPKWDWRDGMLHMNGAVWNCDVGDRYLEKELKGEDVWATGGKK